MRYYVLLFLLAELFCFRGFAQSSEQEQREITFAATDTNELFLKNIQYGPHERNIMDVFLPGSRTTNSVFVINVHGGAWTQGDKSLDDSLSRYLLSRDIAVANINYRYADDKETHLPELLDDVDSALHYLAQHATAWNTRSTGFSLSGASSGAHVVMMYAYTRRPEVKAIAALCGPVDFTDVPTLKHIKEFNLAGLVNKMSGNISTTDLLQQVPPLYREASPLQHIQAIPILIVHGEVDQVVPVRQAHLLADELTERSIPHQLLLLPNSGHNLAEDEEVKKQVFRSVADWLLTNGRN